MSTTIRVPDLGVDTAEIIEILVQPGDHIKPEQGIVLVESDKASMEIPSSHEGVIENLLVNVGDTLSQGQELVVISEANATPSEQKNTPETPVNTTNISKKNDQVPSQSQQTLVDIITPDLGVDTASIIEILVQSGDQIANEQGIVMVESDKASMEIPSSFTGVVQSIEVQVGDEITQGSVLCRLQTDSADSTTTAKNDSTHDTVSTVAPPSPVAPSPMVSLPVSAPTTSQPSDSSLIYAGPAVRKLARHLGVDLSVIQPSGANGRIVKDDVYAWVNNALQKPSATASSVPSGTYESAPVGNIDFCQFGAVRIEPMSRPHQLTADGMVKSLAVVPQVTQFDNADITELEKFRKSIRDQAEQHGTKVTLVAFLVMACAKSLRAMPQVNVSIDRHQVVYKDYCHIGLAVDTPAGLMVPVIRDADTKSLFDLAREIIDLATRARKKTLKPAEMQGGCFTISSLGNQGGSNFTPLVNHPEAAILGVSKSTTQPVWDGATFVPRLMCPLALSYDHRAINGTDGTKCMKTIIQFLEDPRQMLL